MDEKLQRARALCLDQAESFIAAAGRLGGGADWPHIVCHLSLLALEEVGKASMLAARTIGHDRLDGTWVERSLDNHKRKLQWAVWSPLVRIDPADFEAARQFAERAHAMRLASLYVDPNAELTPTCRRATSSNPKMQKRPSTWRAPGWTTSGPGASAPARPMS
jgi:AbiV family abortive infection protein